MSTPPSTSLLIDNLVSNLFVEADKQSDQSDDHEGNKQVNKQVTFILSMMFPQEFFTSLALLENNHVSHFDDGFDRMFIVSDITQLMMGLQLESESPLAARRRHGVHGVHRDVPSENYVVDLLTWSCQCDEFLKKLYIESESSIVSIEEDEENNTSNKKGYGGLRNGTLGPISPIPTCVHLLAAYLYEKYKE